MNVRYRVAQPHARRERDPRHACSSAAGKGYRKSGAIRSVAGVPVPDFTRLAYGLVLASDATVDDHGAVVGDPTEAALVVPSAKLGVDAEESRRAYARLAEVPFDSEYKFMATFHRVTLDGAEHLLELVKDAPDVVLARSRYTGGPLGGSQVPIEQARDRLGGATAKVDWHVSAADARMAQWRGMDPGGHSVGDLERQLLS